MIETIITIILWLAVIGIAGTFLLPFIILGLAFLLIGAYLVGIVFAGIIMFIMELIGELVDKIRKK